VARMKKNFFDIVIPLVSAKRIPLVRNEHENLLMPMTGREPAAENRSHYRTFAGNPCKILSKFRMAAATPAAIRIADRLVPCGTLLQSRHPCLLGFHFLLRPQQPIMSPKNH